MLVEKVAKVVSAISEGCAEESKIHKSVQTEIYDKISEDCHGIKNPYEIEHRYLTMLMDEGYTEVARRLTVYFYLSKKLEKGDMGLFSIMNSMIEINKYNKVEENVHE